MNIVIHSYLSGSFLLERNPSIWNAIIILDSGVSHTDFVAQHAKRHLYLRFDDINSRARDKQAPTSDHLQSAFDFAAETQNLMVCCRAGQSRSAATAFLICYQHLGPDAARQLLNPKRHVPNALIIELGAQLIDDFSVLQVFREWQTDHIQTKLLDHVDDIECEVEELERQGARNRIVKF